MTKAQKSAWKAHSIQSTVVNTVVGGIATAFVVGFLVYGILFKKDHMYDFRENW